MRARLPLPASCWAATKAQTRGRDLLSNHDQKVSFSNRRYSRDWLLNQQQYHTGEPVGLERIDELRSKPGEVRLPVVSALPIAACACLN